MGYYSKYTDRMDIHIEESRVTILIKQKWKYNWLNSIDTSLWTYYEKRKFHKQVDAIIWNSWGNYFYLKVEGTSVFAKRNAKKRWDVNFDIKWVHQAEHWMVNVTKYPHDYIGNPTSNVLWRSRKINLDTKDISWRKRVKTYGNFYQYPIAHEFGHAVGNTVNLHSNMHGDEYKLHSSYFNDKNSLMNIGNELRDRHLDYVISELNTMIPNSKFSKY